MELRRFFRAPLLLIAVAVLLLLFVLDYANSGSSYQQVDTSEIVSLINKGQVKSAVITDKNQTIQITTKKRSRSGPRAVRSSRLRGSPARACSSRTTCRTR